MSTDVRSEQSAKSRWPFRLSGQESGERAPGGRHRRRAAALAASAVLCAVAAPVAAADETPSPAPSAAELPEGLYGTGDPTYNGVWRQSYALLALDTAGVKPAGEAVAWLAGQQCADGGFASYRADTAKACDAKTEDTNATAIAVQALSATGGRADTVTKAVDWLKSVQNKDGGWSYNPGGPSDANSTGVVAGALEAAGSDAEDVRKGGRSAADALLGLQLDCEAKAADRGSFAYQPTDGKLTANAKATTGAVLGLEGEGFVFDAPDGNEAAEAPACSGKDTYRGVDGGAAADAGAAWLAARLAAGDQHLTAATPGSDKETPDFGTTADAVIALAAGGHLDAAKSSYAWLTENAGDWSKSDPSAAAQMVLGAHATGQDPAKAGGTDYVAQLTAMGPPPAAGASSSPKAGAGEEKKEEKEEKDDSGSTGVWWIIGVGLVAGVGIGMLLSARKKSQG